MWRSALRALNFSYQVLLIVCEKHDFHPIPDISQSRTTAATGYVLDGPFFQQYAANAVTLSKVNTV